MEERNKIITVLRQNNQTIKLFSKVKMKSDVEKTKKNKSYFNFTDLESKALICAITKGPVKGKFLFLFAFWS